MQFPPERNWPYRAFVSDKMRTPGNGLQLQDIGNFEGIFLVRMANAQSTGRIDLAAAATGLAKGSPGLGDSRSRMAVGGRIRTGLLRTVSSIRPT